MAKSKLSIPHERKKVQLRAEINQERVRIADSRDRITLKKAELAQIEAQQKATEK